MTLFQLKIFNLNKENQLTSPHSHLGISAITSRPLKTPVLSAIREHICSVRPSAESFTILTSVISDMNILTCDDLLIRELRPSLNGNDGQLELVLN